MKLQASERLLYSEAQDVSYEQYRALVATLSRDPREILAFDFKLPGGLSKLWSELKAVGSLLREAGGISWEAVIQAFQEKSVFRLLKGVGFAVTKLIKAVKKAASIPAQAIFLAIDELAETFGSSKLMLALDPHARVAKLNEVIHRHPVLTKLTGLAVAGFLIWSYLHASSTGHADYDLGLVDSVLNAIHGDYDLADMFASKQGVKDIAILIFGLATGGAGLTGYGVGKVEALLHFLGSHRGEAASLLLALFYAAAKKLGLHIDYSNEPHEMTAVLVSEPRDKAGRTARWYQSLTGPERDAYRKKFPGTRFHDKTSLVLPKA